MVGVVVLAKANPAKPNVDAVIIIATNVAILVCFDIVIYFRAHFEYVFSEWSGETARGPEENIYSKCALCLICNIRPRLLIRFQNIKSFIRFFKFCGVLWINMKSEKASIYGKHAVAEASKVGNNDVDIKRLIRPYKEFMAKLEVTPDSMLVILDEIQDPHNVGAIIRSAAALGAAAVLFPEHNQAPITETVVKVSAGMAFRIPLIHIGNVNNAVRDLKERGFWIYGLDGESTTSITEESFDTPTVFIMGNEANGIRTKTRDLCDIMLRIPMNPRCESMNVASSASIAMYEWSTKHPDSLK